MLISLFSCVIHSLRALLSVEGSEYEEINSLS